MDDFNTPEDLFKKEFDKVKKAGQDYNKFIPLVVVVLFIFILLKGSVYQIGPDEVGVVQRFGKYVRTTEPGLHLKMPLGVETVTPIKVRKIFKEEFGFRTVAPGIRSRYSSRQYLAESLMLTGDLNILDVRWIVQYRVKDPVKLLFDTRNPVKNIRDMSEVVMRRLCGDYSVDEVLTTKREEVATRAEKQLQALLDKYRTGIDIITVKLLDVNPPDKVQPAFNEVNEAKQEKERLINEAWEEYNKAIPRAKGEAKRMISQAQGYALDKVNRARGDAERFYETWKEYKKSPEVTRKRMYLETMDEVLPKAGKKYVVDTKGIPVLPLLKLNETGGAGK